MDFIHFIIYNAKIYDPVAGKRQETALAVTGNTILTVGSDDEVLSLKQASTKTINADQGWLLPGFTDAHTHFLGYVRRKQEVNLNDCGSLAAALARIKAKVENTPEGEWITGGGWNKNIWAVDEVPTRHHLDDISTKHFIALDSKDWHTTWVNTPVLELANIPTDKPYPNAKHLAIHPQTGEFTGILEESVRLKIFDLLPRWDYQRYQKSYHGVLQEFYNLGFSAIHTVETPDEFAVFQEAKRRGELGLRTVWYLPIKNTSAAQELKLYQGVGDAFLRIAGAKIFVDGSFGSQTAEVLEDYQLLGHAGVEVLTESELKNQVKQAVDARLSCAIHAIGDRAIRKTLRVLTSFDEQNRKYGLRHRIEHAQMIHPDDISLFQKYGIYVSAQPVHLAGDIPIIHKYLGERGKFTYPLVSLKKSGAKLIFGSDTPVESFNPWLAIYTAMERRENLDPAQPQFYPDQSLSLADCLEAYTCNPAEAVGMERSYGRIYPGMLADFFLPDRDIFKIPAPELKETRSVLTVVDGKIVHQMMD